jgi:hypothetical protein
MAVSQRLRYEILRRDNHACRYCGATAPDVKLNVDHVIPTSLGGSDKPDNLVTACAACNGGKTSSMPNAATVEDVDQETFRQSVARKQDRLAEHLWRGGHPPHWGPLEIERCTAEGAWLYAWAIASNGNSPSHEQYTEFLVHCAALFEVGHSAAEVVCAAVQAGTHLTPHLSWGLGPADMRHAPISGEQFSRIQGVYDEWLRAWGERHGARPEPELINEFRGRLILGAREGYSRDELMAAARSSAFAQNPDVDYFAYHIACENAREKAGDN